jgi:hypothetical protein
MEGFSSRVTEHAPKHMLLLISAPIVSSQSLICMGSARTEGIYILVVVVAYHSSGLERVAKRASERPLLLIATQVRLASLDLDRRAITTSHKG